jgi:hypothetical protein
MSKDFSLVSIDGKAFNPLVIKTLKSILSALNGKWDYILVLSPLSDVLALWCSLILCVEKAEARTQIEFSLNTWEPGQRLMIGNYHVEYLGADDQVKNKARILCSDGTKLIDEADLKFFYPVENKRKLARIKSMLKVIREKNELNPVTIKDDQLTGYKKCCVISPIDFEQAIIHTSINGIDLNERYIWECYNSAGTQKIIQIGGKLGDSDAVVSRDFEYIGGLIADERISRVIYTSYDHFLQDMENLDQFRETHGIKTVVFADALDLAKNKDFDFVPDAMHIINTFKYSVKSGCRKDSYHADIIERSFENRINAEYHFIPILSGDITAIYDNIIKAYRKNPRFREKIHIWKLLAIFHTLEKKPFLLENEYNSMSSSVTAILEDCQESPELRPAIRQDIYSIISRLKGYLEDLYAAENDWWMDIENLILEKTDAVITPLLICVGYNCPIKKLCPGSDTGSSVYLIGINELVTRLKYNTLGKEFGAICFLFADDYGKLLRIIQANYFQTYYFIYHGNSIMELNIFQTEETLSRTLGYVPGADPLKSICEYKTTEIPASEPMDIPKLMTEMIFDENMILDTVQHRGESETGYKLLEDETTNAYLVVFSDPWMIYAEPRHKFNTLVYEDGNTLSIRQNYFEDLQIGDLCVFLKSEDDKLREIADRILMKTFHEDIREKSSAWKRSLQNIMEEYPSLHSAMLFLAEHGIKVQPLTVWNWLYNQHQIGPQSREHLEIILGLDKAGHHDAEEIWHSIVNVRRAHLKASSIIRGNLINYMSKFPADELLIDDTVMEVEGLGEIMIIPVVLKSPETKPVRKIIANSLLQRRTY